MTWVVEFLDEEVKALLDALPLDIRAHFQRIVELIQSHGLERVREPYVKHLEGPLWEMRMRGKERHRPSLLRDGAWKADRHRPRLREEDPENTKT